MTIHLPSYIRRHFVVAFVAFVILALLTHLHGVWWRRLRFLVFLPVYYVADTVLPARATWQNGGATHIVGEVVINLLGFLWVWLLVYGIARAYVYLKKGRDGTRVMLGGLIADRKRKL
jgi:hypothetical protein